MRGIEVIDYQEIWPQLFSVARDLLLKTLGEIVVDIQHIGSTSVPGLAAKPIIDILLEVKDIGALDSSESLMKSIGYEPKGEFGILGRRHYQKGGDNRSHHIHAFESGDFNLIRHLAFRNYLRCHPEIVKEYGKLKKKIADACNNDIKLYCDGKDQYVKNLEQIALKTMLPTQDLNTDGT